MKKKFNDLINSGELETDQSPFDQNSLANFFDVVNIGEKSYFNLNKSISFENNDLIDPSLYTSYIILKDDCWTNISYKFYKTVKLWWLICKFNNIKNPFNELKEGTELKIPNDELKQIILDSIKIY